MKYWINALLIVICVFFLSSCNYQTNNTQGPEIGIPDLTGSVVAYSDSWQYINQSYQRSDNWKRIVADSEFQLGTIERIYNHKRITDKGIEILESYEQRYGDFPRLDGSTVSVYMALEFARQHLDVSDEVALKFALFSTTHNAYENLVTKYCNRDVGIYQSPPDTYLEIKPVDLIIVTEPSDEEIALAKEHDVDLIIEPVCWDAFVFITHKDNPVDSLTIKQVQSIYAGEITNWIELGGNDEPIIAYQREKNSGSQTTMEKLVMQSQPMIEAPTTHIVYSMKALLETVAEYDNSAGSIGYSFLFYIDALYKNDDIKVLKINDIEASPINIQSQEYPYSTNYFGVIRSEDRNGVGGKFLQWMLSDKGQQCIEQAGYIPL